MHLLPPNNPHGLLGVAILRGLIHPEYPVPHSNNLLWHRLRLHHLHHRPVLEMTLVQPLVQRLVGKTGTQRLPLMGISLLPLPLPRRTASSIASPSPTMAPTLLPEIEPK